MRADLAGDEAARDRFEREALSVAALNHPAIVAVHDTGGAADDGPPYLVMELIEGRSLRAVLAAEGRFPPGRALAVSAEICAAAAGYARPARPTASRS